MSSREHFIPRIITADTVLATISATAAVTVAANLWLGAKHELPTVPVQGSAHRDRETVQIPIQASERYARRFANDPEAGVTVDPGAPTQLIDINNRLRAEGFTGISVTERGRSSDDDDTTNAQGVRTGGFDVYSPKNVALADKREIDYKKRLREYGFNVPITSEPPEEDHLSPEAIQRMDEQSRKDGYASTAYWEDVYDGLNTGTLSPESVALLDEVIGSQREVTGTISGYKDTITHEQTEIPVGLFIPIPIFRFRRLQEYTQSAGPTITADSFPRINESSPHQWYANRPYKMKEPHPQGQGPEQIKRHHSRTHGGDKGYPTNERFKGSRRGN
jgi:hypothetical protein